MAEYLSNASEVKPCSKESEELAFALLDLLQADQELSRAQDAVPRYTGDRCAEDYVASEQEVWNRKADAFRLALRSAVKPNLLR
jgi:hypothetical protein